MQDETAAAKEEKQTNRVEAAHRFLEVGNDLLAKPDALAQLLLTRNMPATVVFCNSPSEADMVEVMLRKKSISCSKLIGNIPHQRLIEEVGKVHKQETTALIITDVAAQDLEIEGFEMVVNYGIHEDPEIYLHRITGYETATTLKDVICLVSPLDFGNFHYLRKVVTLDFDKEELPSDAEVAKAQAELLFSSATEGAHLEDEATQALLESVLAHENRDKIVAMFLYNTLKVIPKLKDEAQAARESGRGRRGRSDRDRNSRNDRGDRNDNNRGNRSRRDDSSYGERENRREERRDLPPPKKDSRLYIGHGAEHGFDEAAFKKAVDATGLNSSDVIKRISVRELYSFVDIPEEATDDFLEKLEGASLNDSTELFIRKATLINVPREETAAAEKAAAAEGSANADTSASEEVTETVAASE